MRRLLYVAPSLVATMSAIGACGSDVTVPSSSGGVSGAGGTSASSSSTGSSSTGSSSAGNGGFGGATADSSTEGGGDADGGGACEADGGNGPSVNSCCNGTFCNGFCSDSGSGQSCGCYGIVGGCQAGTVCCGYKTGCVNPLLCENPPGP